MLKGSNAMGNSETHTLRKRAAYFQKKENNTWMSWNQATENFHVTGERGKQENSSKQMQRLRRHTKQTAWTPMEAEYPIILKKLWPILKPKGCCPDIYHLTSRFQQKMWPSVHLIQQIDWNLHKIYIIWFPGFSFCVKWKQ